MTIANAETDGQPTSIPVPLLQGHQLIRGLWFPAGWFKERERAQLILDAWQPGSSAIRFAEGDLLRFPHDVAVDCSRINGWPLIESHAGGALLSAPLETDVLADLPPAMIHLVLGTQAYSLQSKDGHPLDPSQWLSVDAYSLYETYDEQPVAADLVELTPSPAADVREILRSVPAASAERKRLLDALDSLSDERGNRITSGTPPTAGGPGSGGIAMAAVYLTVAIAVLALIAHSDGFSNLPFALIWGFLLFRFILRSASEPVKSRAVAGKTVPKQPAPPKPIKQRDLTVHHPSRWRRWLQQLALTSQLSKLLGRQHAAYMRRMMELFESGNLAEALRHAIPIDGKGGPADPGFGVPQVRDALRLSDGRKRRLDIGIGGELQAYLRKLYRQSFEKLDRENRIDEAVFVLAELLEARTEALDYLERKQRYAQAAELALMWDLSSGTIIRLHCLAGDWRTAIAVARRDNAFRLTVSQMEPKYPEAARRLRMEWAEALATQGEWLEAVDAIWPLTDHRNRAVEWLMTAESSGHTLAGRALVQRAHLLPGTFDTLSERLEALRDDPQRAGERAAIARALLDTSARDLKPDSGANRLGRLLLASIMNDQTGEQARLGSADLQRLISSLADPLLDADLPSGAAPGRTVEKLLSSKNLMHWPAPEAGSQPIIDAATLEDGCTLLAFGEVGAAVVDAHGRVLRRYPVPAYRIVIANSRRVALVMARRDRLWRVSRLDLTTRTVIDLGMVELGAFATSFDGIAWTVSRGNSVFVLDTQRSLTEVLWRVGDLPGQILAISTNIAVEQLYLMRPDGEPELWRYELPQRRLKARDGWKPAVDNDDAARVLLPWGGVLEAHVPDPARPAFVDLVSKGRTITVELPDLPPQTEENSSLLRVHAGEEWILLAHRERPDRWYVISLSNVRVYAVLDWPAECKPMARACGSEWLVHDDHGRLVRFDTETSDFKAISIR